MNALPNTQCFAMAKLVANFSPSTYVGIKGLIGTKLKQSVKNNPSCHNLSTQDESQIGGRLNVLITVLTPFML